MLLAISSATGAPGATTAAVALAACWPPAHDEDVEEITDAAGRRLVVEADPAGGVLAARYGLGVEPGLAGLAAAARGGVDRRAVLAHAQRLDGGLPVVVAPAAPVRATRLVVAAAELLGQALASLEGVALVVVDCGRLTPSSPAWPLANAADMSLVVARPILEQLQPAAAQVRALTDPEGPAAGLLLVGSRPYGAREVAEGLEVPVAGVLPDDPQGAAAIGGADTWRTRAASLRLAREAEQVAGALAGRHGAGRSGRWRTPNPSHLLRVAEEPTP